MPSRWMPRLQVLLFFWAIVFLGALFVFVFETEALFAVMNELSTRFTPEAPLISLPSEHFWMVLTISLMITLCYLCLSIALDLNHRINWVPILLISKLVSTLSFLAFYFTGPGQLAYLLGAITDGSIFLLTAYVYGRARRESNHRGRTI